MQVLVFIFDHENNTGIQQAAKKHNVHNNWLTKMNTLGIKHSLKVELV